MLFIVLVVVYNLNGREIGNGDSQPTKFLVREIVLRGTFTLDETVRALPPLARRPAFQIDRHGHYRSAYPVAPAVVAAGVGALLHGIGVLDLEAPLAPALVAKLTASALTAWAVVCAFLIARRTLDDRRAVWLACGLGLGTSYWAAISQTLWQHELAAASLMSAVWLIGRDDLRATRHLWIAALLLGISGAARPQLAPAIALLAWALVATGRGWRRVLPLLPLMFVAAVVLAINLAWFGHPLGAVPRLEALHAAVHHTAGTWQSPLDGAVGLLVSPSRGLLIFSPIVAAVIAGIRATRAEGRLGLWLLAAAAAQFILYASYSVWWGGYTYGPRYTMDLLPLLVPAGAHGLQVLSVSRPARLAMAAAALWSVLLAGTGAWCYPHEQWNTSPTNIDHDHARLWDWEDPQFVRCWKAGLSPQNFSFLEPGALRSR